MQWRSIILQECQVHWCYRYFNSGKVGETQRIVAAYSMNVPSISQQRPGDLEFSEVWNDIIVDLYQQFVNAGSQKQMRNTERN